MAIQLLAHSDAARDALSRVELVYTDLDGTLLGIGGALLVDGEGRPSARTAEAVTRVNAAGLTVVPVTGRNRVQCVEITRMLGWRGFLAELGCVVVADRFAEPIYETGDWPDDALLPGENPWHAIERVGAVRVLTECFAGRIEAHAPYHLNREATHLLRGHVDLEEARAALESLALPVRIVDNGVIHPLSTGLVGVEEVHSYHLMPPGVTKTRAVADDLVRRGIGRERAAAIGDAPTDVEMAEATALCVLVGNALGHSGVAQAAERHTNVVATVGPRGDGWVEFANAWLAARGVAE